MRIDKAWRIVAPVLECAVIVPRHLGRKLTHQCISPCGLLQSGRSLAVICHRATVHVVRTNESGRVASSNVVIKCHLRRRQRRLANVSCIANHHSLKSVQARLICFRAKVPPRSQMGAIINLHTLQFYQVCCATLICRQLWSLDELIYLINAIHIKIATSSTMGYVVTEICDDYGKEDSKARCSWPSMTLIWHTANVFFSTCIPTSHTCYSLQFFSITLQFLVRYAKKSGRSTKLRMF